MTHTPTHTQTHTHHTTHTPNTHHTTQNIHTPHHNIQHTNTELADKLAKEAAQEADDQNIVYASIPTTSVATELKKGS